MTRRLIALNRRDRVAALHRVLQRGPSPAKARTQSCSIHPGTSTSSARCSLAASQPLVGGMAWCLVSLAVDGYAPERAERTRRRRIRFAARLGLDLIEERAAGLGLRHAVLREPTLLPPPASSRRRGGGRGDLVVFRKSRRSTGPPAVASGRRSRVDRSVGQGGCGYSSGRPQSPRRGLSGLIPWLYPGISCPRLVAATPAGGVRKCGPRATACSGLTTPSSWSRPQLRARAKR